MALTRKMLKAFGIEDEKVDEIIEAHAESVDALKRQRDEYKAEAEKVPELQKQLEGTGDQDELRAKLDAEHEAFEKYRAEVEAGKAEAEKRGLYRKLLEQVGVDPKRIDSVLRVSDLSGVSVKDGALDGADALAEKAKADWSDFIAVETTKGAVVKNPPKDTGGGAVTPKNLREALHQRYDNKE